MAYLVALLGMTVGVLVFMWAYGRHLEALSEVPGLRGARSK